MGFLWNCGNKKGVLHRPLSEEASKSVKRFLDPIERISEILFGLVMVLTITCSFSVGGGGRTEVRQMLIGALGCNVAWGVIDAVLYWMACFHAHGQKIMALRAAREENPEEAYRVIADALPPVLASVTTPAEFEAMRRKLQQLPPPPQRPHLTRDEWLAGLGVFLLVVLATFPVVLPFLFDHDPARALRISNGIAVLLLFFTGYAYGHYTGGLRPLRSGLIMIVIGAAMVGITIALGG